MNITEVKAANKEAGFYFFSPSSMRFFNTKIERGTWDFETHVCFITRERFDEKHAWRYTVRSFNKITCSVNTDTDFQKFATKADAIAWMKANK